MLERERYLKCMGITLWKKKCNKIINLNQIKTKVSQCNLCILHKTRKNTVFGTGNETASIMLIGEAPGANEDKLGQPFVGQAGLLLNAMLKSINLKKENLYITNILKCRPPNNRDPLLKEIKICTMYLLDQINFVNPKILVAIGRIAAQFLLDNSMPISKLRGKIYYFGKQQNKIPVLVTYHPAYLLRSLKEKKKAFEDLLILNKLLNKINNN